MQNFAKKVKNAFAFFASKRNAKTKRPGREKKLFAKNEKFSRNDFSFSLETLNETLKTVARIEKYL